MKPYSIIFSLLFITGISANTLSGQDSQQTSQPAASVQDSQSQVQPASQVNTQSQAENRTQTATAPKPKLFPEELSIADQFVFAIDKSNNFQDYKVIRLSWLSKLKSNTLDTLSVLQSNLKKSAEVINEKNITIETLRSELNTAQSELKEKNSFRFLWIMVSKAGYDSIMWTIILGLVIGFVILFIAFRRSFNVTSQTKKDLNELKEEYENYRKKALKSKEEAVRQLYDELNKYKNKK